MEVSQLTWITNFIWGIADDVLRDLYVRGKYRDVILPMTVIRRLDAVLEPTKQAVLDMKANLDKAGITNQDAPLRQAAAQAFYNTSTFTLRDLKARAGRQQLEADFRAYLDGFSPNVQEIIDNFEFRNQIPRLAKADALGTLIEKFLDPSVNLSPYPVRGSDGTVRLPGLDNHAMGTIFEELVRRFNEKNNEEAGEHWTPRDAVRLMARLIFEPIADRIESGTYLLYDGACGTGGMLTVAEETLLQLAAERGKQVSVHLFGQEINAETYAICKADLLLKGEGDAGQGESNIRRWIIENDWLEAIVALPLNMFYNTGIATYIWLLTNRKPEHRKGRVQLIDATQWYKPLRKNLGKKNCELSEEDIRRIVDTFLQFKETEQSKIFPNAAFGYWKVTVERPLRLKGIDPEHAYTPKEIKDLREKTERAEDAPPVIKKVHKPGTTPDPLRGLFEVVIGSKRRVVEYEPNTELRDSEQIPFLECPACHQPGYFPSLEDQRMAIETFLRREVLPYTPDAWYDPESVRVGYEINFNRYFYKPKALRSLEEIRADLLAVEKEAEGLLAKILGGD